MGLAGTERHSGQLCESDANANYRIFMANLV